MEIASWKILARRSWYQIHQLEETVRCHQAGTRNDRRQEDGMLSNSRSLPQTAFIVVSESTGDFYVHRKPFNLSCNPNEDSVNVRKKMEESKLTKETRKGSKTTRSNILDNCLTYCIIVVMIVAFVAVLASVTYFAVKTPRVAKLLFNVTSQARNSRNDSERALMQRILNPVIAKDLSKYANETSDSATELT
ncbi:PREDICTED: uncharacterized protein LOC108546073 isoform X1 [Eufriesea mexicana]|uniref:uncharacterized protein LOC108546073 isoform X1 n=2 Tax=Eufriesea mexicana TaxID=516756 RepID=UPI00083BCAF1|nr:PREDICTED: uncharacterized protein LOC108546073 isoform X1 [Eufriesea mexicana]